MHIVLSREASTVRATTVDDDGRVTGDGQDLADLAAEVVRLGEHQPRWVWDDTTNWYPALLDAGVRVDRCIDLRLCHGILRSSSLTATSDIATAASGWWDEPDLEHAPTVGLFDLEPAAQRPDPVVEFARQRAAVAACTEPARLTRLLAAESAGALAAAEMKWTGLPWRRDRHEALLTDLLGSRPAQGQRPERMRVLVDRIRTDLSAADLNPDSPPDLLRALNRAGIRAESTRSWELQKMEHPVIGPLLEYKKLARLLAANGWHWLDQNIRDGRFHPDYVPGGVVTGRWASKGGGGALQLPKQVRGAVVADPGWKLVVADAAQLEPRILAALSGDRAMVAAGESGDLYASIVASGAVDTRGHAKTAMLAAMYGATSGEAGRLLPRLSRAYPSAIALVEDAARAGERGEIVTTRLGRSSPPGAVSGYDETADQAGARNRAKAWGRFTRNFIVQGTAAEWALCWMAVLRRRLHELGDGASITESPHLVFFLHDEVVVHSPVALANGVEDAVRQAATDAGRLLFGALPVRFPLTVVTVDDYGEAK